MRVCLVRVCGLWWRENAIFDEYNNGQMWGRRSLFFIVFVSSSTRRRSSFLAFYSFDLCLDQPTLKPPKKKR